MHMITLRNIHKSFGKLEVLKGIDLDIAPREVVSIVGPSGAGKTTLLQIMGTLYKPDEGTVNIAGCDVLALSSKKLSRFRADTRHDSRQTAHRMPQTRTRTARLLRTG